MKICENCSVAAISVVRIHGSHHFPRDSEGRTTVVPVHAGDTLGRGLLSKILRDCELDREQFRILLSYVSYGRVRTLPRCKPSSWPKRSIMCQFGLAFRPQCMVYYSADKHPWQKVKYARGQRCAEWWRIVTSKVFGWTPERGLSNAREFAASPN